MSTLIVEPIETELVRLWKRTQMLIEAISPEIDLPIDEIWDIALQLFVTNTLSLSPRDFMAIVSADPERADAHFRRQEEVEAADQDTVLVDVPVKAVRRLLELSEKRQLPGELIAHRAFDIYRRNAILCGASADFVSMWSDPAIEARDRVARGESAN